MRKYIILCIVFILFSISLIAQDYTVRTIYFKPTDSFDISEDLNLDDMIKNIQSVYQLEMDRHGYPGQTFRLETDDAGDVIVHKINGKHAKAHYIADTINKVIDELPDKFQSPLKNIHIVIVAGMDGLMSGQAGGTAKTIAYGGWFDDGRYGGYAFASEMPTENLEQIITHELGHTFGLWHIALYDAATYILGSGKRLAQHEARWLSKCHYFNDAHAFSLAPKVVKTYTPQALVDNRIKFSIDVRDADGVYQIYLFRNTNILGWDYLIGQNSKATVVIPRRLLPETGDIWSQIMDQDGNWFWYNHPYEALPDRVDADGRDDTARKNPDLDLERGEGCRECETEIDEIEETDQFISVIPVQKLTTMWGELKRK